MLTTNVAALAVASLVLLAKVNSQDGDLNQYQIVCKARSCLVRSAAISFKVEGYPKTILVPLTYASTRKSNQGNPTINVSAFSIIPGFMKTRKGRFYISRSQISEQRVSDRFVESEISVGQLITKLKQSTKFTVDIEYAADIDIILHEDRQLLTEPFVNAIERARSMIRRKEAS